MSVEVCQTPIAAPLTVIRHSSGWNMLKINELWKYRELFYFLAWRNLKVRYKQTILGISWALLQPIATMIVFTFIFGRLANLPSDGIPYPIFALSGLIPWTFFSNAVIASSGSIVSDANLIKKIYFPRIIIPFSSVFAGLLELFLGCGLLLAMMPFYEIYPNWNFLFFPFLVLLVFIAAMGVGLWLSTMNALFRDVHHLIPFVMQIWLFITPIVYPSSALSSKWQLILSINPMVAVVETFRWMMLGTPLPTTQIMISCSLSLLLCITGIVFFRKMEPQFADIV